VSDINVDEQVRAQTRILAELADLESKDFTTKKDYITNLKNVTRPLIVSGFYPDKTLSDFCSLIQDKLEEYSISYPRTKLAELFDEDEKRSYNKKDKPNVTSGDNEIVPPSETQGDITGILDHLEKKIGKSYDTIPDYEAAGKLQTLENIANKSVSHVKTFTRKLLQANYFVDAFEKQFADDAACSQVMQGLPRKQKARLENLLAIYNASVLLISEMESNLAEINDIKEIQAMQAMTSKDVDQRSKLTNWEKLNIWLAMKASGIAKNQCAKLNGIDKKHITNNIYPRESPTETHTKNKHHDYVSWFRCITVKLGGKDYTIDIARYFDEQIERGKLNLEFKPLVVATAKSE